MRRPIPAMLTGGAKGAALPVGRVTAPTRPPVAAAKPIPTPAVSPAPASPVKTEIVEDHETAARFASLLYAITPVASGKTKGVCLELLKRMADEGVTPDPAMIGSYLANLGDECLDMSIGSISTLVHHFAGAGFHLDLSTPAAAPEPEKTPEPGSGIWEDPAETVFSATEEARMLAHITGTLGAEAAEAFAKKLSLT